MNPFSQALARAIDDGARDAAVAMRSLRRAPAFAAATILTLALGIAAASAMFTAVNGILLRPLPVDDDARLVVVRKELPKDGTLSPFGHSDLRALERQDGPLEGVAGVQYDGAFPWVVAVDGDRATSMMGTLVSGTFFQVLGARPALGRLLERGDAVGNAEPVVVLSYALWRRAFGGDSGVLGRRLQVNGETRTVVGVGPHDFEYPSGVELWVPLPPVMLPNGRELEGFSVLGRLRPGSTIEAAAAAVSAMLRARVGERPPGSPRGFRVVAVPLRDAIVGEVRLPLLASAGAVALVFAVALLNTTALMLLRGLDRAAEIRLRSMLGARPGRLARQLLAESAVLAGGAALLGVVLAWWALRGLILLAPASLPRLTNVGLDVRGLAVAAALAALGALVLSLGPGLQQVRAAVRPSGTVRLSDGDGRRGSHLRNGLVAAQIALAFLVAVGAGLLAKSFARMQRVDLGFDVEALTLLRIDVVGDDTPERHHAALASLTERLQAVRGVTGATPVLMAPFSGRGGWDAFVTVAGQDAAGAAANPGLNLEAVQRGYFSTLHLPLMRGRALDERDRRGGDPVVMVSSALAGRFWPGDDAVGKRLKFGSPDATTPWHTVVGVAADARYRDLLEPPPALYVPLAQTDHRLRWLVVRTPGEVVDVRQLVAGVLGEVAPGSVVLSVTPLRELLSGPLALPRFATALLGTFASLAVILAAVGLYSTMASMVARRRREIAMRMALGSTPAAIKRLVVVRGLVISTVGVAVGLLLAAALTRGLRGMLFGVGPLDLPVLLATAAMLVGIAALACYVPPGRAASVPPASALRAE
ncbi:MAG: ADOP family duplicated permease [Gemmatimonadota bacterium]|nr:ADOP family duplicated permease [Gemmatimonadota bacterium]